MKSLKNRFIQKFSCAIDGLVHAFHDRSVVVHLVSMFIALLFACILQFSIIEYCIVVLCCGLVIVSEIVNTCIEKIMNFIEPNYNESVKEIKDLAAGFVLVASITSLIIAIVLYGSKLLALLMLM